MDLSKLQKKRFKTARLTSRVLARFPFARAVILNGSLAQGRAKKSSDIDILIIAKSKRIFTCRFFINTFASLIGIKRSSDEKKDHSGKFCFNYFLTEDFLKIPVGRGEVVDRYCAENYSKSILLAGDKRIFNKFISVNLPLFDKYQCRPRDVTEINKQNNNFGLKQIVEVIHRGKLGDLFERIAKNWQIKKIESDKRVKLYPDFIVYNDKELRFHPPKNVERRK